MTPRVKHRLLIQVWVGYGVAVASALAWALLLALFFGATGEAGGLAALALWGLLALGLLAASVGLLAHVLYWNADRQMPPRLDSRPDPRPPVPRERSSRD